MHKRMFLLIFTILILAILVLGCQDWDGMDRSGDAWLSGQAGTEYRNGRNRGD